jgi:hypothetical protein
MATRKNTEGKTEAPNLIEAARRERTDQEHKQ